MYYNIMADGIWKSRIIYITILEGELNLRIYSRERTYIGYILGYVWIRPIRKMQSEDYFNISKDH